MFTPTQPLARSLRRLRLTTKKARKGFYKGTGTGSMGHFNAHPDGRPKFPFSIFRLDYAKVRSYVRPLYLDGTPLTPFVGSHHGRYVQDPDMSMPPQKSQLRPWYYDEDFPNVRRMTGEFYLHRWKRELGGH